jgi:2-polyprenyl-3-methyl-5-hydroxy-6-metoxy-1,4-benzoquinol methylase
MNYRNKMYEKYVSYNKQFLRDSVGNYQKQDLRNINYFLLSLSVWLDRVSKSGKILDVACGEGNILKVLAAHGFTDIYGVDISQEQVALAREMFPQVVCGDAIEYLKNHENQFVLITAFDILEHFQKNEALQFLEAINSALVDGGRLILQMPNGDSPFAGNIIHGDFTHEVTYTSDSLKHVLLVSGFSDIEYQESGPLPNSMKGIIRYVLWKSISQIIKFVHIVETGGPSTGIYTRVMRATAVKKGNFT